MQAPQGPHPSDALALIPNTISPPDTYRWCHPSSTPAPSPHLSSSGPSMQPSVAEKEPTAGCSAAGKQADSKKSDTLLSASVSQFKELKDDPIISPRALHSRGPLKSVTCKTKLYPSKTQQMESLCLKSGAGWLAACPVKMLTEWEQDRSVCPGLLQVQRKPYMLHCKEGEGDSCSLELYVPPLPPIFTPQRGPYPSSPPTRNFSGIAGFTMTTGCLTKHFS